MITLEPDECRVLGVLVEKAQTTPAQYPMTLNSITAGCNQKNNRHPVVEWDEERVYDAIDGLRAKKLVSEVQLTGSRVAKFKHNARDVLGVDTSQLVVLTELLLRGPQSLGDIRGNASRMHPLESLDSTRAVLEGLMTPSPPQRDAPMVKEVPPPPGGRARLYVQLLCPDLHFVAAAAAAPPSSEPAARPERSDGDLAARVKRLEDETAVLREAVRRLESELGIGRAG